MRNVMFIAFSCCIFISSGCSENPSGCSGFTAIGNTGQTSFTVPQLMAHAAAMGLTQQEAETLIYLEGISSTTEIEPGETLCIDGRPG